MSEYFIRINSKGATLFVKNKENHALDMIEHIHEISSANGMLVAFQDWIALEDIHRQTAKQDEMWYSFMKTK